MRSVFRLDLSSRHPKRCFFMPSAMTSCSDTKYPSLTAVHFRLLGPVSPYREVCPCPVCPCLRQPRNRAGASQRFVPIWARARCPSSPVRITQPGSQTGHARVISPSSPQAGEAAPYGRMWYSSNPSAHPATGGLRNRGLRETAEAFGPQGNCLPPKKKNQKKTLPGLPGRLEYKAAQSWDLEGVYGRLQEIRSSATPH